ncbi:hypothetical protein SODALDRAFT_319191 [Sodiomyces alkalinus F11]|uniref:Uncharacterized protein n=1 Tax=Sodiomyces alkalinus (strain CBS 110278 / VKM F-3762 / F11) TaxID=1314773 RepID=A0A3N2Q744_SODAK|nr:hypothetical protein SODALDRAFT_319191 [Sodiomyces alkalinus F11]ROT42536.1 hypothetical protein SODALDRAFT_319191 [Sodiomyces alkalinus F11]
MPRVSNHAISEAQEAKIRELGQKLDIAVDSDTEPLYTLFGKLQKHLETFEKEHSELLKGFKDKEKDLHSVRQEIAELQNRLRVFEKFNTELHKSFNEKEGELRRVGQEKVELQSRLGRVEKTNNELQKSLFEKERELHRVGQEEVQLQSRLGGFEKTNNELQKSLTEARKVSELNHAKLDVSQSALKRLQNDVGEGRLQAFNDDDREELRNDFEALSKDCEDVVSLFLPRTGKVLYDPRDFLTHPVTEKIPLPPIQNGNIQLDSSTYPSTTHLYRAAVRVRLVDALIKFVFCSFYIPESVKQSAENVLSHLSGRGGRSMVIFRCLILGLTGTDSSVRDSVVERALDSIYGWLLPLVAPTHIADLKDRVRVLFQRAFEIWCRAQISKDHISTESLSSEPNFYGENPPREWDELGRNTQSRTGLTRKPSPTAGPIIATLFPRIVDDAGAIFHPGIGLWYDQAVGHTASNEINVASASQRFQQYYCSGFRISPAKT